MFCSCFVYFIITFYTEGYDHEPHIYYIVGSDGIGKKVKTYKHPFLILCVQGTQEVGNWNIVCYNDMMG